MNRTAASPRALQAGKAAVAAGVALALAACHEQASLDDARAYHPIPPATLDLMAKQGATEASPMLIRTFKKEAEFEVWKMGTDGRYAYIKTFPMCRWSGQLGPKTREGDRQVPEGFYTIAPGQMNPNSHYYLSFNVGYPNAYDTSHGDTGSEIMVHGVCSSAGCFSMTDAQIDEIYAIAREAFAGGQREIQMESFPFHMTAENLAKFRFDKNMPFWRQIKAGSDYFEATHKEPTAGVCGRHYVFDKVPALPGTTLDPTAPCPPLKDADPSDAALVAAKQKQDDQQIAALVARGAPAIRLAYQDGGQNPDFANKIPDVSQPSALLAGPTEIAMIAPGKDAPPPPAAAPVPKLPATVLPGAVLTANATARPVRGQPQHLAGPIMSAAASARTIGSRGSPTLRMAAAPGTLNNDRLPIYKNRTRLSQPMQTASLTAAGAAPAPAPAPAETPFYEKWISAVGEKLPPFKLGSQASNAN